MDLLAKLVHARIGGKDLAPGGEISIDFFDDGSELGNLIRDRQPSFSEYVTLLLALAPHAKPALLDREIRDALNKQGDFPEIGGSRHGFIAVQRMVRWRLQSVTLSKLNHNLRCSPTSTRSPKTRVLQALNLA